LTSVCSRAREFLREYRALLVLGGAALLAELAYAVLNLSAMPMYVNGLGQFSHYGLIFGTFLAVEALSRPALGALGDRIGRKPLMLAGPLLTAVTAYLTIVYRGPFIVPYLIGLRAIDGLGSSAMWMNAFAAVGDVVGEKHRSAAMSVLNVTYMGGMALGFLLGGAVNDYFHTLNASFYLSSALFVMAFLIMLFFFPKLGKPHHVEIPGHESHVDLHLSGLRRMFHSFAEVPDMVVMAVVTFLGMGLLTPIVKVYGVEHLHMSETGFGLWVAPIAAAMGIFAVPLGHLGDRFGKTTAVCWGLLASSLAMWILALFKSLLLIGVAGIVIGLGFTVAFPAWNALVISSTDARRRGEVLGAVGLAQGLAAMAGTLVAPHIYESDSLSFPNLGIVNYNVPFWISAILISAGTVICFTWVCRKRVVPGSGDRIGARQRVLVVALAIFGLVWLGSWIGWRYAMPVVPDRVAWSWVQRIAQNKPHKSEKYALARARGWDAVEVARAKAGEYNEWIYKQHGSYHVDPPRYISDNTARVEVIFRIPEKENGKISVRFRTETVVLCKTNPRGEWKVCGVEPR